MWPTFANGTKYAHCKDKHVQWAQDRGFTRVIAYNEQDIDQEFQKRNARIFQEEKGFGYWLWKPYPHIEDIANHERGSDPHLQ